MLYIALPRFAGFVLPLLIASALQAQTIPNPSFEANGDFATFPGYAANNGGVITGWTMSDATHIGINGTNGPFYNNGASPDGTHVAFLQSTGGSSVLSNTITGLIPGVSYQVSFRANSRAGYAAPAGTWSLNGGAFVSFTASPTVNSVGVFTNLFYANSAVFVATSTTAPLVIRNQTVSDTTVLVDDFSIFGMLPTVTTFAATGISNTVATLNGTVTPAGPTTAWFEWGLYPANNTNTTTPVPVGSNSVLVAVSNVLSGLAPGLIYRGRIVADNGLGIVHGSYVLFGSPLITLNGAASLTNECHTALTFNPATASGPPLAIAGGYNHSLALRSDGTVVAWGNDTYGQTNVPVGLSNVVAIAGGNHHSLALQSDGTVVAWGIDDHGQTFVPEGLSNAVAVAGGIYFSLALRSDGTVVAWGENVYGQTIVPAGLSNVVAIASGGNHNLALKSDGTVAAWGLNDHGQTNVPASLSNVVAVAGGVYFSLALRSDGTVVAWGDNSYGQTNVPAGLSNVVAVAGGYHHSLALRSDGTVVAWGDNSYGQTNVPAGLSNAVAVAAGVYFSLALQSDGTIVGWGDNSFGQTTIPGDLSSPLAVTTSGSVDTASPGSYVLTYTCTNFLGGVGSAIRTVVVSDTIAPVLTLLGNNPLLITNISNLPLVDPGATAVDLCDQGISIVVSNTVNVNFPGTYTITYRSTDASGNTGMTNRTVIVALPPAVPGDQNGDGIVSQSELDAVYARYVTNSPWLYLTNVAGLGGTNVTFALNSSALGSYTVQYSTNLVNWLPLGPATPRYLFTDTNAPAVPQRYYRLVYP